MFRTLAARLAVIAVVLLIVGMPLMFVGGTVVGGIGGLVTGSGIVLAVFAIQARRDGI